MTDPPPLNPPDPPPASSTRKTITLIAMSAIVAGTLAAVGLKAPWPTRTFVVWRAHSGQRMPTDVEVMHSGQIGRPQFEHETPVSRFGWR
jgi:hypothetical protein